MTVAVRERSLAPRVADGGAPARRAVGRWALRLFRREWRQQLLVLLLLIVAVAATVVGLGVAASAAQLKHDPTFGTANTIVQLSGNDPALGADIAALQSRFGQTDVIAHQSVPIPGSISNFDVRAQNPHGPFGSVTLRLDSGRFPRGAGEVAVTSGVARTFGLHVGSVWMEGGRTLRVVGMVENPLNLGDQFALVAPGQISSPDRVSVLLNSPDRGLSSVRLPGHSGVGVERRSAANNTLAEAVVLVLGSLGLLFVGLMSVAGFTVMAQRRLRSLGMLGAVGATDRNVRLVMLANGAAVGAAAAVVGAVVGLLAWLAFVPTLESISGHRIDRFALPWPAIAGAMALTFVTAVGAAWWPARAVARISVVSALSGRPPKPQPAHRFAAFGCVVLAVGIVMLAFADQRRAAFIIVGTVATAVGVLFLAPLAIRMLVSVSRHASISVRLALRDLSRYQARSGAALGAVTLALAIAATIVVSAAASETPSGPGNLASNQMMLYTSSDGGGGAIPRLSAAQLQMLDSDVAQIAGGIQANTVLPLTQAYDRQSQAVPPPPGGGSCSGVTCTGGVQPDSYPMAMLAQVSPQPGGGEEVSGVSPLYVATPAVLRHFGIDPSDVNSGTDVISSLTNINGLQIFVPDFGAKTGSKGSSPSPSIVHPTLQTFSQLPKYTSAPTTFITQTAVDALGLRSIPSSWFIQTGQPLTADQINSVRQEAAAAGLYIETRQAKTSLSALRNWSTTAGILLALGVLAMTVGLIRSETANDLRTLAATGASSNTRRNLTSATAAALALLGALLGTACAYAAMAAWYRSDLRVLDHPPVTNLVLILVGLPAVAAVGGWLLAGREPAAVSRRPLE